MAPAQRAALAGETVARLAEAVAASLNLVFLGAGLVALVSLALALLFPARLNPHHGHQD
jgi:hypothetical protein